MNSSNSTNSLSSNSSTGSQYGSFRPIQQKKPGHSILERVSISEERVDSGHKRETSFSPPSSPYGSYLSSSSPGDLPSSLSHGRASCSDDDDFEFEQDHLPPSPARPSMIPSNSSPIPISQSRPTINSNTNNKQRKQRLPMIPPSSSLPLYKSDSDLARYQVGSIKPLNTVSTPKSMSTNEIPVPSDNPPTPTNQVKFQSLPNVHLRNSSNTITPSVVITATASSGSSTTLQGSTPRNISQNNSIPISPSTSPLPSRPPGPRHSRGQPLRDGSLISSINSLANITSMTSMTPMSPTSTTKTVTDKPSVPVRTPPRPPT